MVQWALGKVIYLELITLIKINSQRIIFRVREKQEFPNTQTSKNHSKEEESRQNLQVMNLYVFIPVNMWISCWMQSQND